MNDVLLPYTREQLAFVCGMGSAEIREDGSALVVLNVPEPVPKIELWRTSKNRHYMRINGAFQYSRFASLSAVDEALSALYRRGRQIDIQEFLPPIGALEGFR